MPEHFSSEISQAVLHTLLYSDIFDFPLTAREIHRYLLGVAATNEEVNQALREDHRFIRKEDLFALSGREEIINTRKHRETQSRKLMPYALKYGRVIGSLPFVRMVALTGSLAVMNVSKNADFDYLLVTAPGRLWTARAFTLLFARITHRLGRTVCPNLLITENSLEWQQRDLYSARELCQMLPITGINVYRRMMKANEWIKDLLPNAEPTFEGPETSKILTRKLLEIPLRGKLGDRFEQWEMNRKIARFSKQEGFGEETVFNAELCQGNFDHHRSWTENVFQEKLQKYQMGHVLTDDRVPAEARDCFVALWAPRNAENIT